MHDHFRDKVLERLVNGGTHIRRARIAKYEYAFVNLSMLEAIDDQTADDLARLVDADARSGPPASLAELGDPPWVWLELVECRVGPRGAAALSGAKRLSFLSFKEASIDDATLACIKTLPALRELRTTASIGDDGLQFLETSPNLEYLVVPGTRAGDATLARIRGAHAMREMVLSRTKISDSGLRSVSQFAKLERLNLKDCGITDAGLEHLAGLDRLERLNLSGTKITDAGVRHLRRLRLRFLDLRGTRASDACLQYLAGMKLSVLGISGSRITKEGVAKAFDRRIFTE